MNHTVKCHTVYFDRIIDPNLRRRKTTEVRFNDRNYQEGDTMTLLDWDPDNRIPSGKWAQVLVTYKIGAPWLDGNMVALSVLLQDFGDENRQPIIQEATHETET